VLRNRRILVCALVLVALLAALLASGPASGASKPKPNPSVKIGTAKVGSLGTVLVDSDGHVLYMFQPDKHTKVACNSDCQSTWPPLVAPVTGVAEATGKAQQSLIGSDKNPYDGKRIVTYNGWPLYTFVTDGHAGTADGQNLDLNGGYWWVLTPAGHVEK
jgi:predicted lipoprotein with Yx(FWY)xxD motif